MALYPHPSETMRPSNNIKGYFGIGIYHGKNTHNVGTLWRSAQAMGAAFIFNIGPRYKRQSSDTTKASHHIPFYEYKTLTDLYNNIPKSCMVIGVEQDDRALSLHSFTHPCRAIYLLGAEDHGIPPSVLARCHVVIQIPTRFCLNVSVAGSIVMYDRVQKQRIDTTY